MVGDVVISVRFGCGVGGREGGMVRGMLGEEDGDWVLTFFCGVGADEIITVGREVVGGVGARDVGIGVGPGSTQ